MAPSIHAEAFLHLMTIRASRGVAVSGPSCVTDGIPQELPNIIGPDIRSPLIRFAK